MRGASCGGCASIMHSFDLDPGIYGAPSGSHVQLSHLTFSSFANPDTADRLCEWKRYRPQGVQTARDHWWEYLGLDVSFLSTAYGCSADARSTASLQYRVSQPRSNRVCGPYSFS